MLHCAPGRTDVALAANSGSYNAGIAAGAALGGLVLPLTGVRDTFLAGGLLTTGACAVPVGRRGAASRTESRRTAPAAVPGQGLSSGAPGRHSQRRASGNRTPPWLGLCPPSPRTRRKS